MGSTCKCSNYLERKEISAPSFSSTGRENQSQQSRKSDNSLIAPYLWLCGKEPHKVAGLEYEKGPALATQTIFPR